ncbi:MAG: carbohydrate kinase [Pseudomonadota bacterium]
MNTKTVQEPAPILFGEVLFDCFEDGSRVLGGAPFNVAWHLQAFGCAPLFISRVGDDPMGRQIRDTMQHWGMRTAGLQQDSAHHTGEVRVTLAAGQPSFDIIADRAFDHIHADALPPMQAALIYHGSLGLRLPESATSLEKLLHQHPAPIFLDVNLRPPWWDKDQMAKLLDRAQWVKINDDELERLVVETGGLHEKAQRLMQNHDLTWVIVTRGEQGAFLLDEHGNLFETTPSPAIEVVDTVGAGDAFAAVCILGLLQNWPAGLMMQWAQAFASLLVGQRGATIRDPAVYTKLIEQWQLSSKHE